jgi:arsenate reductase
MKKTVLFLCTHNSARSQMAEGLLRFYHGDEFDAESAGVVSTQVKEHAVKAMNELGIDMSGHRSKSIEEFRGRMFDYVVTVCDSAKEACPFFPGRKTLHQAFGDPSDVQGSDKDKMDAFRKSRDEIMNWLENEFMVMMKN